MVTNTITNKCYIGYSSDWKSRRRTHKLNALQEQRNYVFYNSIRKHGFENFVWSILYQSKDKEHTLFMEQYFIEQHNTLHPNGYNMKEGGSGGNLSDDAKRKLSKSRKGIKFTDKHKRKLSESHKGLKHSDETRKKMSQSMMGVHQGNKKGPLPSEVKNKISDKLKNTKRAYTKRLRCSCVICHKEISNNHIGIHYKIHG